MTKATMQDVERVLTEQHQHIKDLMQQIIDGSQGHRDALFTEFVQFLAAHEAAEEECIHATATKDLASAGASVVDERLKEEDDAGAVITRLEKLGPDADSFMAAFTKLSTSVIAHAEAEEHQELPKLAPKATAEDFERMLAALERVPRVASTFGSAPFVEQLAAARTMFTDVSTPT